MDTGPLPSAKCVILKLLPREAKLWPLRVSWGLYYYVYKNVRPGNLLEKKILVYLEIK